RHLKSPADMQRLFAEWPHAISATREVADACDFTLDELRYEYPQETVPGGRTPQDYLEQVAWEGAARRYPDGIPDKVRGLITRELVLIGKMDIARYFLTIKDIVDFARGCDPPILCQGRGSAANSAVCYCIGITSVDPAQVELLFERFISEERKEPPDIDVDFEHERREEVIQHIYARYGRQRAGLCATVIHYRPRSAIREVGKAMGLTEDVTATIARTIWGSWGSEMDGDRVERETGLDMTDPYLKRAVMLADQMIGLPRHLSQHVGGFILTQGPLTQTVPIGNGAMPERSFIEWDKDDIDELRIMKVDVLALGMLTCIRKSFDLIAAHHGKRFTLATVPQEEPAVYDMLCKGDSIGVFQVESRAQMNMLPKLKPRRYYDLVIEVAIVRPGPIQGDMVHPYLKRRQGRELDTYPSPGPQHDPDELKNILGRTLGVPIFQEQAMKIAIVAAEFSPEEANKLRKAMATFRSRGLVSEHKAKMVGRMVERGYDREFATRCFSQIEGFGEYGFPESHAASFAHLVYISSWIKCFYPDAFCAALLNSQPMGFYAPAQIVRDAQEHGVEMRAPDVNYSNWDNLLEPGRKPDTWAVRLGFRQIGGFKEVDAEAIMHHRTAPYADVTDIKERTRIPVAGIEKLAAADAFRSAGLDRRQALWDTRALKQAPDLPLFTFTEQRDEGGEQPVLLPSMPECEHVVADYQTMRLSLKAHPFEFLRAGYERDGFTPAATLRDRKFNAPVKVS
ncbi:MAG: error-prone DNA polymerase, partial [Pontixanthobacter sp.]